MKNRWTVKILAAATAILLAAGCSREPQPPALLPLATGEDDKTIQPVMLAEDQLPEGLLARLETSYSWGELSFGNPRELSGEQLITLAWQRFMPGAEGLRPEGEGEEAGEADTGEGDEPAVIPAETMADWIRQYFDVEADFSDLDPDRLPEGITWQQEEQGFLAEEPEPVEPEGDYTLEACWDNGAGTLAAVTAYTPVGAERAESRIISLLTLQNGVLRWVGRQVEYINYNEAGLKGKYTQGLEQLPGRLLKGEQTVYAGKNEQHIYLCTHSDGQLGYKTMTFYALSVEDLAVSREMTFQMPWQEQYPEEMLLIKDMGDHIQVVTPDTIYRIEHKLGAPTRTPWPEFMAKKLAVDEEGGFVGGITGYDVSEDMTKFLYTDSQGLHLYQLEVSAGELAKRIEDIYWAGKAQTAYTGPPVVEGANLTLESAWDDQEHDEEDPPNRSYGTARFVDGDEQILVVTTDTGGVTTRLMALKNGPPPEDWIAAYLWQEPDQLKATWPGQVLVGDMGISADAPLRADRSGLVYLSAGENGESEIKYYDFARGQEAAVAEAPAGTLEPGGTLVGPNGFVYCQYPADPTAKKARVSLVAAEVTDEGTEAKELLTANAVTWLRPIVVLEDGRCICYYYAGAGEEGLLITNK